MTRFLENAKKFQWELYMLIFFMKENMVKTLLQKTIVVFSTISS